VAEVVEGVSIACPRADVWAVLAEFDGISGWAPNVDHSCLTTIAADGVGATRRIQTGRTTVLETVTEWEPQRRLAYTISGLPPVVRSVTNAWRLDARGDTTDVTLTSTVDAGPRPPQQLVARIVCRVLAKASRQMLGGLERHLGEAAG
jgi:uncharacterized protein YndB with AHSA1/START domain